jgi:predicted  nucleic acid-binding Zn-ribbon protein
MWKSNKVTHLLDKKHKIEKEIEKIQRSCKHPSKSLKSIRERVDSHTTVIRWVCDDCSKSVGYPSKQETDRFFRE